MFLADLKQKKWLILKNIKMFLYLQVLQNWKVNSIDCHVSGFLPAASCDLCVEESMAKIVGAFPDEVKFV